jgi:GTP pyrophosphokinase
MPYDLVESAYQEFQKTCRTYLPAPQLERVHEAFVFAKEAHGDQTRKSGEPYITHPIAVAHSMARLYVDDPILIGALLHDVAEDTERNLDEIEKRFGPQIRHLVDGVTHLSNVSQLEDLAHLFLAMSSDVRVVLIKLFDRLHNMQTLDCMPLERRRRKALDTLNVYVPLAQKLGLWQLKNEFETLILQQIDPDAYELIQKEMREQERLRMPHLQVIAQELQGVLNHHRIPSAIRIKSRSPYRIYESMSGYQLDPDLFIQGFQIIIQVDSLADCYLALGYIHKHYPHLSGSLTDTIGNPRDIFYRSLHTSIIAQSDYKMPVQVRIRTYEFDRQSEIGIMTQLQFAKSQEVKQPAQAPWLPRLPELYHEADNPQAFVENVFQDILQKSVVCFTPRGQKLSLPRGATTLDFAYYVHTDIGHECRGAIVNGETVEINHRLNDGDHVQIVRSRNAGPLHEWLDDTLEYVATARAKQKIRDWFKRQTSESLIRIGREALREERRRLNAEQVTAQMLALDFEFEHPSHLYLEIGGGSLAIFDLARAILKYIPDVFTEYSPDYLEIKDDLGQTGWLRSMGDYQFKLARCCQPKIGDGIIGHVNEGQKLTMIHRASCHAMIRSRRTQTLIRLAWIPSNSPLLVSYLQLTGYDRGGLIRDISIPIAKVGGNILHFDSEVNADLIQARIKLELPTADDLIRIIHRLAALQNITAVQRMTRPEIKRWKHGESAH